MGQAADIVRRCIELYNDGTPEEYGSDRFLELYAPGMTWEEMPSAFSTSGRKGDAETLREEVKNANKIFRNRHIELKEIIGEGNTVAWRGVWSVTVAVDTQLTDSLSIEAGNRIKMPFVTFMEVTDGLIVRQQDYLSNPKVI